MRSWPLDGADNPNEWTYVNGGHPTNPRRNDPPAAVRVGLAGNRMVFTWDPDRVAANHRLEISESDSFATTVDSVTTPLTSYAPLLTKLRYTNGGSCGAGWPSSTRAAPSVPTPPAAWRCPVR